MVNTNGMHLMSSKSKIVIFFSLFERPDVELKAWSNLRVIEVAILHIALGLKEQANVGTETEIRIDFRQEGSNGCLPCSDGRCEAQKQCHNQPFVLSTFHS